MAIQSCMLLRIDSIHTEIWNDKSALQVATVLSSLLWPDE